MDSPIYTTVRIADGQRIYYSVYPRFFRVSMERGKILVEYGAAHVVPFDAARWPHPRDTIPPGGMPEGSICLDRYGNYKQSHYLPIPAAIIADNAHAEMLRAVRAMRPADVSHMQCDDNGCGPAIVARLTGLSYAEAVRKLFQSGNVRILGTERFASATGTTRHLCNSKSWDELEQAGAVAALIKNEDPRLGRHYGHYVSIDPGMIITDPELVLHYPLAEYPRKTWTPMMYFVRT